jgi:hypothetical protein
MSDPPTPMTPAVLLAAAARFGFVVKVRDPRGVAANDLGVFLDGSAEQWLVVTSGGADGVWALLGTLPAGFGPVLIYRAAYDVLHGGATNPDGSIAYSGRSYRIQSYYDGEHWTAKALVMGSLL